MIDWQKMIVCRVVLVLGMLVQGRTDARAAETNEQVQMAAVRNEDGTIPCGQDNICNINACPNDPDCPGNLPPPPPPSPFVLKNTGVDQSTGKRALSAVVGVVHGQPDGTSEHREFQYSTPKQFAGQADRSVNLWLVFHGMHSSASSMHRFFDVVPHDAPTVLVYPQALCVTYDNIKSSGATCNLAVACVPSLANPCEPNVKWRVITKPGHASDADAFRDVVFVDWLASEILEHNPQLNPDKVYVSGFSSGASMSWMLLCYRSRVFQGFAMYSGQLGALREDGACGDGELQNAADRRTGYEKLTGKQPDKYGHRASLALGGTVQTAATKAVFYAHGTADPRLLRTGEPGCWKRGQCIIQEDPKYSMDPTGPLKHCDDVSTVNWLTRRHQLSAEPATATTVPDQNPSTGYDQVATCRSDYKHVPASDSRFVQAHGEPIRWYAMIAAAHSLSAVDQGSGSTISKDYDVSLHTQRFFEDEAEMLRAPGQAAIPAVIPHVPCRRETANCRFLFDAPQRLP